MDEPLSREHDRQIAMDFMSKILQDQPLTLFDNSALPLPKLRMKAAFRAAWLISRSKQDAQLESAIRQAHFQLSHFLEGVGPVPIDCKLKLNGIPDLTLAENARYFDRLDDMAEDGRALEAEWADYTRSNSR